MIAQTYQTPDGHERLPTIPGAQLAGACGIYFIVEPSRAQLVEIARRIDASEIRPVLNAVLPLARAREAFERARVTVQEVVIEPGGRVAPHRHAGPMFGCVLEGEYEHALDDEPVTTAALGPAPRRGFAP